MRNTGAVTIDPMACTQSEACRIDFFVPDVDAASAAGDLAWLLEYAYVLLLREVNVTALSTLRLCRTFHASGLRGTSTAAGPSITLANGSFDVPLQRD